MADLREKLEQQNSELKLQLNASQQARATMQLELTQKDEMNKQDLKRLKEELNENFNLLEADAVKELEQMLKEANAREAKALSDLNQNYQKILEQFDEMISEWYTRVQAKNKEHAEKYESLKIYYKNQLDKSNKDILGIMEKYDSEMNKLRAQIKRLEIKCGSLEMALQQKTKECEQLATLRRD
ncbi:hypothetical protein JTB14_028558 [Gonioctena quinquepunctata]|nr:hypothetical protein JTB14_028558 [Gonioctena quinquepunctata]